MLVKKVLHGHEERKTSGRRGILPTSESSVYKLDETSFAVFPKRVDKTEQFIMLVFLY